MQQILRLVFLFFSFHLVAQSGLEHPELSTFLKFLPQKHSQPSNYVYQNAQPIFSHQIDITSHKSLAKVYRSLANYTHQNLAMYPTDQALTRPFFASGFFPFRVFAYKDILWLMDSTTTGRFGQPIQSIEGYDASDILSRFVQTIPHDKGNTHGMYQQANERFAWYLYLLMGKKKQFKVTLGNQLASREYTIKSSSLSQFYTHRNQISKLRFQHHGLGLEPKVYFWLDEARQIATLRINSFDVSQSEFHGLIASFIKRIQDQGIKKLILDLRFNSSLYMPNAEVLASFLTQQKFINRYEAYSTVNHIPNPDYVARINHQSVSDLSSINQILERNLSPITPKGFVLQKAKIKIDQHTPNPRNPNNRVVTAIPQDAFTPDKNYFKGRLVVLSSPNTRNAAYHAIRMIQQGNPTVQTVGLAPANESKRTSMGLLIDYHLTPMLYLQMPLFRYSFKDRLPDKQLEINYPVLPLIRNHISTKDMVMNRAIELLLAPPKKRKQVNANEIF